MVVFRPFRGWKYNPDVVGDLNKVVCPPYDLITPELQESLLKRSPFNVVHLEAGENLDWNAPGGNTYRSATDLFEEWLRRGVLRREPEPCFYLTRHIYQFQGQTKSRIGITGCVRLAQYDSQEVFPHEFTEEPAVMDRVALMEACNANFSPIMSLYRDPSQHLATIFEETMSEPPAIQVHPDDNQEMSLWIISEADQQSRIRQFFNDTPVFLADGHHRYEAALRFQAKRARDGGYQIASEEDNDSVMMTLIEFDDPGLLVLPYHRVVSGLASEMLAQLQERLLQLFGVNPSGLPSIEPGDRDTADGLLEQVIKLGDDAKALGVLGPAGENPRLLSLKKEVNWQEWGPLAVSEAWILEEQVLKPVLGDLLQDRVTYIHDHEQAMEQVRSGDSQMAFLVKPFPMNQFYDVVSQGQRLPRKSTFFYPKLPTGLVINQLDGAF